MDTLLALLQIIAYGTTLMLAGYLLNRGRFNPITVAASLALIAYALIQADQYLGEMFPDEAGSIRRVLWAAYPVPVVLWARLSILLNPKSGEGLDRVWWTLMLPITMIFILGGWISEEFVSYDELAKGSLFNAFVLYSTVFALFALWQLRAAYVNTAADDRLKRALFWLQWFGAGFAFSMPILSLSVLSPAWVYILVLIDFIGLAIGAIAYDAISEGQNAQRDLALTLIKTLMNLAAFVMPWLVALALVDMQALAFALALFAAIGMVSLGTPLSGYLENLLDRVLFAESSSERQALRIQMENAMRAPESPVVRDINRDEFVRLTRRALSHMPNLPRLAGNPLTDMRLITQETGADANSLERANQLRQVLAECIETLRPRERGDYGTTDEWRFFNALYYPYVNGISPYKRNLFTEELDTETAEVVKWFQAMVPPRTMYNWQNRGAEMIAEILLQQEAQIN